MARYRPVVLLPEEYDAEDPQRDRSPPPSELMPACLRRGAVEGWEGEILNPFLPHGRMLTEEFDDTRIRYDDWVERAKADLVATFAPLLLPDVVFDSVSVELWAEPARYFARYYDEHPWGGSRKAVLLAVSGPDERVALECAADAGDRRTVVHDDRIYAVEVPDSVLGLRAAASTPAFYVPEYPENLGEPDAGDPTYLHRRVTDEGLIVAFRGSPFTATSLHHELLHHFDHQLTLLAHAAKVLLYRVIGARRAGLRGLFRLLLAQVLDANAAVSPQEADRIFEVIFREVFAYEVSGEGLVDNFVEGMMTAVAWSVQQHRGCGDDASYRHHYPTSRVWVEEQLLEPLAAEYGVAVGGDDYRDLILRGEIPAAVKHDFVRGALDTSHALLWTLTLADLVSPAVQPGDGGWRRATRDFGERPEGP